MLEWLVLAVVLLTACADGNDVSPLTEPGGTIYTSVYFPDRQRDFEVWALDPATGESRAVPTLRFPVNYLAAAPSAPFLILTFGEMNRFDFGSGTLAPLWDSDYAIIDPAVSPSNRFVSFLNAGYVWIGDLTDRSAVVLDSVPEPETVTEVRWLSDSVLVFMRELGDLWRIDRDGRGLARMAGPTTPQVFRIEPSHDGRFLALYRVVDGAEGYDVKIVEIASGKERRLARLAHPTGALAWSPQDEYVATGVVSSSYEIDVLLLEVASGRQRLLRTPDVNENVIAWAVDP
jgi:hypothetical protein